MRAIAHMMTMRYYRLLHVEDDPMDTRLFGMMLDEIRVDRSGVRHVTRVGDALAALRREPVDIVFLDLDLPDSGGLATVERVLGAGFDVPVVVLTGIRDEEIGVQAVALGAQDYLVKGVVHAAVLGRVLRYAVGRAQALTIALQESARAAAAEARLEASQGAQAELEREVTSRLSAQARLEASLERIRSLRAVDATLIAERPVDEVLGAMLDAMVPLLGVAAAALSLVRDDGFAVAAHRGMRNRAELLVSLPRHDAAVRTAQERGHATFHVASTEAGDAVTFTRLAPLRRLGLQGYGAFALHVRGEPLGVLELYAHEGAISRSPEWVDFVSAYCAHAANAIDAIRTRARVVEANEEIVLAYDSTIRAWSRALDLRNRESADHSLRVTESALRLARLRGFGAEALGHLRRGALLHEIGTMAVPDAILLKAGSLTGEERAVMERHTIFGRDLLASIPYLRPAADVAYAHHERWDGAGYPRGVAGEAIPLAARIFAVVNVYDALISDRPYRRAWRSEQALAYIAAGAGSEFDPAVVDTFLNAVALDDRAP